MTLSIYRLVSFASLGLYALCGVEAASIDARSNGRFSLDVVKLPRDEAASAASSTGSYPVSVGSSWHFTVKIGTPPQSFQMLPDSGAPSLAVRSVFLPANESDNAPVYNPNKSSTAKKLAGYTYKNCYGSGHCGSGVVYSDVVTVGNLSVTLPFEVATANNGVGNGGSTDSGDFGLSYTPAGMTTSPKRVPTWFQAVMPQLESKLFTINYHKSSGSGTFDFGGIDASQYTGSIGYTPNAGDEGFWTVEFSGYAAGASTALTSDSWKSIVDSGTSDSAVPRSVVDGYFKNIAGATYDATYSTYSYPCSTSLPDFVFGITGASSYRGIIPGSYIEGASIGSGKCVSHLIAQNGTVIFGQNFIEAQFVVLDYGNNRIGFANKPT